MNLYRVTVFDRKAPDYQFIVALWASSRWAALERGMKCGRVLSVTQMRGEWPLDVKKHLRLLER